MNNLTMTFHKGEASPITHRERDNHDDHFHNIHTSSSSLSTSSSAAVDPKRACVLRKPIRIGLVEDDRVSDEETENRLLGINQSSPVISSPPVCDAGCNSLLKSHIREEVVQTNQGKQSVQKQLSSNEEGSQVMRTKKRTVGVAFTIPSSEEGGEEGMQQKRRVAGRKNRRGTPFKSTDENNSA